jgi:hypothetical protein
MRRRVLKTSIGLLLGVAGFVLAAAAPLRAETAVSGMPLGSIIKGFDRPQRNATGDLEAMLHGDQATVVSLNRIQITGLRIDLYEKEKVATTITSPLCDFWNLENRLSSHDGVLLVRPEARISADAIDWDFKTQVALLRKNVKVVLPKFTVGSMASTAASAPSAPVPAAAPEPTPTPTPMPEPAAPASRPADSDHLLSLPTH